MDWIWLRYRMYETVLFCLSIIMVYECKNRFTKMIFGFISVMIFSSLFDKLVFKINHYSYTDAFSTFIALTVAIVIFHKNPQVN